MSELVHKIMVLSFRFYIANSRPSALNFKKNLDHKKKNFQGSAEQFWKQNNRVKRNVLHFPSDLKMVMWQILYLVLRPSTFLNRFALELGVFKPKQLRSVLEERVLGCKN